MVTIIARISDQQVVEVTSVIPTPDFMNNIATNYGGVASDYSFYTLNTAEEGRYNNSDEYALVWVNSQLTGIDFSVEDNKSWLNVSVDSDEGKLTLNNLDVGNVQVYDPNATYSQDDLVYQVGAIWKCQAATTTSAPVTPPHGGAIIINPGIRPIPTSPDWALSATAVMITMQILLPDKSGVDTSANFDSKIPIQLPNGSIANMAVTFESGVCQKVILHNNIDNCGDWMFPSEQKRITLDKNYRIDQAATYSCLLPY